MRPGRVTVMPWNIGSFRDLVRRTAPTEPNTVVSASQKPQSPLWGFSQTSVLPLVDSFLPASGIQNFPSLDAFWFKLIHRKQSPSCNQGDSGRWAQPDIAGTVIIITHIFPICWLLASTSQWHISRRMCSPLQVPFLSHPLHRFPKLMMDCPS